MGLTLRRELLSYGTALLVLKGLESRHHLVSQRVGRGRAASVPAVSAELRRLQNRDLHDGRFQEMLPDLLDGLGTLTTLPYINKEQLLSNVVGQVYRGLHSNLDRQAEYFARFRKYLQQSQTIHVRTPDYDMKAAHANQVLVQSGFYGMVRPTDPGRKHTIFQVLSMNPGRRMYIQRAARMGTDAAWLAALNRHLQLGLKY